MGIRKKAGGQGYIAIRFASLAIPEESIGKKERRRLFRWLSGERAGI